MKKGVFLKALSVLLGTTIGVGMFGLPFVAFKAGFFIILFYFLLMGVIIFLLNSVYGEVILGTKGLHRLPGYVKEYLGERWKKFTFLVIITGLTGALLAYLIIGGEFLKLLFSPFGSGNSFLYSLFFFAIGSYLVFRDIKSISQVEFSLLIVFLIILAVFFLKALPSIEVENLQGFDLKFLALPYGVVLFSLMGTAILPEVKEMLLKVSSDKKEVRKSLKKVIFWTVALATLVYLLFVLLVLGASGSFTSEEALSGLGLVLGDGVIKLGYLFGIISCFTSFIALSLVLKKVFWYDFGFPKNTSWFLSCFLPLTLFLLGVRRFIEVIGFTGAVSLGLEGIIIVFLYRAFLKKKFSKKINPAFYFLVLIFSLGIIFELIYFFS